MFTIYQLTNEVNKNRYIGFTTLLPAKKRFQRHKTDRVKLSCRLHKALSKYGSENFTFSILEMGENEDYGLAIAEPMYISWLQPEYNMTQGGEGKLGVSTTLETRLKLSIAGQGKVHSVTTKMKISSSNLGRKLSSATRQKISKARQGKKHSQQTKDKISTSRRSKVSST